MHFSLCYLIGAAVGSVLGSVALLVAFNRKGSVARAQMTWRRIVLHSAVPPQQVYWWLTQNCPPGYKVDDADPARGIVVLSSGPSLFTYGFLFPAFVSSEGAGTRVDLGIKSKAIQYGPLVTRAHLKLANTLGHLTRSQVEGR